MTPTQLFFFSVFSLLHYAGADRHESPTANYDMEFAFEKRSFLTSRNWGICLQNNNTVYLDPTVSDYGAFLSEKAANISASIDGGGSILLEAGVYPVKTAVIMPSNVCLIGKARDMTILRVADKSSSSAPMRGVIRIANSTRVTMTDFTVDCNRNKQENLDAKEHFAKYGVAIEASNYTFVSNVRVEEALGYGFDSYGSEMAMGHHVAIQSCVADSCSKDGFKISRVHHASIVGSLALNNGRHGIHITKGSQLVNLEGNKVLDSGYLHSDRGCGIMVDEGDGQWPRGVRMRKNRVHNAYYASVCLEKTQYVEVEKTEITNNVNKMSYCFKTTKAEKYTIYDNSCDAKTSKQYSRNGGEVPEERCIGYSSDGACCPKVCGECGGSDCAARGPAGNCCASHIKDRGTKCMFSAAPCVM